MNRFFTIPILALSCSFAAISNSPAQTATLIYNDGVGAPASGSYNPGTSFTFAINLNFVPGGSIGNIEGLSYWFQISTPSAPFYFAITLRDLTGSTFSDPQTTGLTYPQGLVPSNANDLGALRASTTGVGGGNYFVANLTVSIDPSTPAGTYTIQNVTSGGKTAFIFNDQGGAFAIPQSNYTITVVPEPTTLALAGLGLLGLTTAALRRRVRR